MKQKHRGAHNELVAAAWLLRQGYEVFRNVSPHGSIDVIAMKDGKCEFFDVKTSERRSDGSIKRPQLLLEQKGIGVKCLAVFEDGTCEIDQRPLFKGDRQSECPNCGTLYDRGEGGRRRACSPQCWNVVRERRK